MPSLASSATIRTAGSRRGDRRTIADVAHDVHTAILNRARWGLDGGQPGTPSTHPGPGGSNARDGLQYSIALSHVIADVAAVPTGLTDDERARYIRPVYEFLRASGNAICVDRATCPPTWWIASTWDSTFAGRVVTSAGRGTDRFWTVDQMRATDTAASPIRVAASTTPTPQEAKLTAKEAGEDREPGEVTVTRRTGEPPPEGQIKVPRWPILSAVLNVLADGPATAETLAQRVGVHSTTARHAVKHLMDEGMVVRLPEKIRPEGYPRSAFAYALAEDVPVANPSTQAPEPEPEPEPTPPPVAAGAPAPPDPAGGGVAAKIRALRDEAARADEYRARAEAAEAEVDRLRAELAEVNALLNG